MRVEVSSLSDENIIYPIIALTIVILSLLGCVLFVLYTFWIQNTYFGSTYFFDKASDVKAATRKKLLLMRRRGCRISSSPNYSILRFVCLFKWMPS